MTLEGTAEDIRTMQVRGAGKIAQAAAGALIEWSESYDGNDVAGYREHMKKGSDILIGTRPTAVSLRNAVNISLRPLNIANDVKLLQSGIKRAAEDFIRDAKVALDKIEEYGCHRIPEGAKVMTVCNSQAALRPIIRAHEAGKHIEVYATESRPWRQGHLTAKQLSKKGVPVTLIVDGAVRYFIDEMDLVMVGADTIASTGIVINKIGTSQVALCAHEARVPFLVCAETFKFSPRTARGEMVEIEERDVEEVVDPKEFPGVKVRNPVFDQTPPEYVKAIITEKGIISPYAAYEIIRELQGDMK